MGFLWWVIASADELGIIRRHVASWTAVGTMNKRRRFLRKQVRNEQDFDSIRGMATEQVIFDCYDLERNA